MDVAEIEIGRQFGAMFAENEMSEELRVDPSWHCIRAVPSDCFKVLVYPMEYRVPVDSITSSLQQVGLGSFFAPGECLDRVKHAQSLDFQRMLDRSTFS